MVSWWLGLGLRVWQTSTVHSLDTHGANVTEAAAFLPNFLNVRPSTRVMATGEGPSDIGEMGEMGETFPRGQGHSRASLPPESLAAGGRRCRTRTCQTYR